MKYQDPVTGEIKTVAVKAADSLPIGTIVEYEGAEIPKGYELIEDEVILYNNNEGTTTTVTLSDSAKNYKYFEIYYKDKANGSILYSKIFEPNNKKVTLSILNHIVAAKIIQLTPSIWQISDKTITKISEFNVNVNSNVISSSYTESSLSCYIVRVVGHK